MTRISRNRSFHNHANNLRNYNLTDAKIDNPHLALRDVQALVKEARTDAAPPLRRRRPLSALVRSA